MREDEVSIEIDGLLIVLGGLVELAQNEMKLCTVVVDVRILGVLVQGFLEILRRGVAISWAELASL